MPSYDFIITYAPGIEVHANRISAIFCIVHHLLEKRGLDYGEDQAVQQAKSLLHSFTDPTTTRVTVDGLVITPYREAPPGSPGDA